ncbi:MAG: hypothetical protein O9296_15100 [Novosphingobium sp.]|nr:hypothetical protein [Novosphingobium sp.]
MSSNPNRTLLGRIEVTATDREASSLCLSVDACSMRASASGSAYFQKQDVNDFCESLLDFPLNPTKNYNLKGGLYDPQGIELVKLCVGISIELISPTGKIAMIVTAAHEAAIYRGKTFFNSGECVFFLDHENLALFSNELKKLNYGEIDALSFDSFSLI